jgi:hypothetical protein
MTDVTRILGAIEQGDPHAAEQLLPLVYDELRALAAQRLSREYLFSASSSSELIHQTIFTGGGELRHSLEDDQSQVIPLWRGTAKVEDIANHGFEDRASALSSVPQ